MPSVVSLNIFEKFFIILQPILRDRNIKKYTYNFTDKWLIATFPSKHYNIDDYLADRDYLLTFDKRVLEQSDKKNINSIEVKNARKKTNNKRFKNPERLSLLEHIMDSE